MCNSLIYGELSKNRVKYVQANTYNFQNSANEGSGKVAPLVFSELYLEVTLSWTGEHHNIAIYCHTISAYPYIAKNEREKSVP